MEKLIQTIKNETAQLKADYLEKTLEWADRDFNLYFERTKYKVEDWCKYLGIKPLKINEGTQNESFAFPKGFYNTKESKTFDNALNTARRIVQNGKAKYVAQRLSEANQHYEDSVLKLASLNREIRS